MKLAFPATILLTLMVCLFAVAACTQQPEYTPSTMTQTTIHVYWQPTLASANATCQRLGLQGEAEACALSDPSNPAICDIYTLEPKGFGDSHALATLGHEAWHCLGAKHPEAP